MKHHLPIRILVALSMLLGTFTFSGYGESWDVNGLMHYADSSISMYGKLAGGGGFLPSSIENELPLGNYGPAYVMLMEIINRFGSLNGDGPHPFQHLVYFITFQVGVIAFYFLCLRWMDEKAAFGATLLFSTQPVFWGHAFINPKDIPFLTFFLLTLLFGLKMADNLRPAPLNKETILALTFFGLFPFLVIFFSSGLILARIEDTVRAAAAGGTNIISLIASDVLTAPPEIYIQKYSSFYIRVCFFYLLVSIPVLFLFYYFFSRSAFSTFTPVALAAVILGFTISIRNLGIFAGLLVSGHILWKHGRKTIIHLLFYGVITAVIIYLLWPYLWMDPTRNLFESVVTMSRYPWSGTVLFNGVDYPAGDLPVSYLPLLLGIQLTEPVWVLFIVGLMVAVIGLRKKRALLVLTVIWFVLPLIGFIVARAVLYDNFRQVLFILPPVFFMAGIVFEKIKQPWVQALVIVLCAVPGIVGIVGLHPYEYIYYNSYIGGVDGAFRKFELDYWGTSYREAADYLNEIAPEAASIWVEGPAHLFGIYARQDLKIYSTYESEIAGHYDYIVATTRYNLDQTSYPGARIIHAIARGDAILAVIKQP